MSIQKCGYWFAADFSRRDKQNFIAIHTDSWVRKSFTSSKLIQVYELLCKAVKLS